MSIKQETFDQLVQSRLDLIKETLLVKAKEYSRNNDPLHNFNKASEITGQTPEDCLDGFLMKHYVSYRDMLKDSKESKTISENYIREKFGDILVYFILQEIQFLNKYSREESDPTIQELKNQMRKDYLENNCIPNYTTASNNNLPFTYTK